jgi:mono/diheme cytochrome c family protein
MIHAGRLLLLASFLAVAGLLLGPDAKATRALQPQQEGEVPVGTRIGKLTFKDIRYLERSLDDFGPRRAFVLVFVSNGCPLVQRYYAVLRDLEAAFRDRGVQFVAVNVGPDDSILEMAAQAVEYEVPFPVVKDRDHRCVRALGVKRTPEAVVLDGEYRLRYRGRIDDRYRVGGVRPGPAREYLREAVEAVLEGREPAVAETPVDGCPITPPRPIPRDRPVTYAQHIAPILIKHCQECHRPGTAAPFALMTYEQAASKAATIAEVVADGSMPPWYGYHAPGAFFNERRLTAEERELILAWALGERRPGDLSQAPPSPWADRPADEPWRIGQPDLVLQAPEHVLPAAGDIPYKYVILPYTFPADTWVQAVEIRPDNPRVVHHCNLAYIRPPNRFEMRNFITGTVPGAEPLVMDEGVGFCIPKGSLLAMQIHYVASGKEERCRISVGLRYARGVVDRQLRFLLLATTKYVIPPHAPFHPVRVEKTLPEDVYGLGLFCHMHLRGKDMTFRARYPDGTSEMLLMVPNYNFDWQMGYRWKPGTKRFPKGTVLECLAHYDNSAFNPFNPDPNAEVRDGEQTHQEMMNGFFFYVLEHERLGLRIDGRTGQVLEKASERSAEGGNGAGNP